MCFLNYVKSQDKKAGHELHAQYVQVIKIRKSNAITKLSHNHQTSLPNNPPKLFLVITHLHHLIALVCV